MSKEVASADSHEWVSFEDPDEQRTWIFDVTFLTSGWSCIFGQGCQGVLTGPTPELAQGCCSYGAHFTSEDDRANTERRARLLRDDQWQLRKVALKRGGPTRAGRDDGGGSTRIVDGACIFLNRPGFEGGAGCALHRAALEDGSRPMDWKPEVCWQLPLRRIDESDAYGHVTSTVREWKRRDWGPGGLDFHWWCTDAPDAFVDHRPVYETLRDELVAMVGARPYRMFVDHVRAQTSTPLPHPAIRSRMRNGGPARSIGEDAHVHS